MFTSSLNAYQAMYLHELCVIISINQTHHIVFLASFPAAVGVCSAACLHLVLVFERAWANTYVEMVNFCKNIVSIDPKAVTSTDLHVFFSVHLSASPCLSV